MPQDSQTLFSEIDHLLELQEFKEAIKKMHSLPKIWLNQFYLAYPQRHQLLKHPKFDEFWAKRRSELPKYTFVAQPNITDMDFVLGYVFYLLALSAEEKGSQEDFYKNIEYALGLNSIHAAQTFLHKIVISKTNDAIKKTENIAALLLNWEDLAQKHGTPGYILLANGYLHLLRIYRSELKNTRDYSSLAVQGLWKNLTLAQQYELESEASIHNAYFGKGLALSNPMSYLTISDMKSAVRLSIKDEDAISIAETSLRLSQFSFFNKENKQAKTHKNKSNNDNISPRI